MLCASVNEVDFAMQKVWGSVKIGQIFSQLPAKFNAYAQLTVYEAGLGELIKTSLSSDPTKRTMTLAAFNQVRFQSRGFMSSLEPIPKLRLLPLMQTPLMQCVSEGAKLFEQSDETFCGDNGIIRFAKEIEGGVPRATSSLLFTGYFRYSFSNISST
jgi:hypothetical protein